MQRARDMQDQMLEKAKFKPTVDKDAAERIRQREQEMFKKKHLLISAKEESKQNREVQIEYKGKVASRLHQET